MYRVIDVIFIGEAIEQGGITSGIYYVHIHKYYSSMDTLVYNYHKLLSVVTIGVYIASR